MVLTTTLLAIVLAISTLAVFVRLPRPLSTLEKKPEWVFGFQLICLFVWKLIHVDNQEYNVDESTWIANALAVIHDADFFSALLTYTTARPITVLPLLILDRLHLPIDFYYVKVVALVCIILTIWLTFLALRNLTNARLALLCTFPLTVFYLAVQFYDFLSYNSELVCNVFVAAGIWLYSLLIGKRERLWQVWLVGVLLGLIPFAKFQAIPAALIVVGFCLYEWIRQRRFASASIFIIAGLMPLFVTVCYCLLTDQLTVLIRNYFLYYVHYSYQYSAKPLSERFSPGDIVYYYSKQHTFAVYWFGLVVLIGISMWQLRRHRSGYSPTLLMAVLLWGVSIYETIQAGTNYEHYLTLVLVPHALLAALLVYPAAVKPVRTSLIVVYGYLAVALITTFFSRVIPFERSHPPAPYDPDVVALIKRVCTPQDRITIWGWADRYYVLSGIAPASRFTNSVLQIKPNAQKDYYLDQYARDLRQNKPTLFLDAVAEQQFTYDNHRLYGHERFPAINQLIANNYRLIYEQNGVRAYALKEDATSRQPY